MFFVQPFQQKIIASQLATGALANVEAAAQAEGCPRQFPENCPRFPTSQGVSKDCSGLTHVDTCRNISIFGSLELKIYQFTPWYGFPSVVGQLQVFLGSQTEEL